VRIPACWYRCKQGARAGVPELLRATPPCWQLLLLACLCFVAWEMLYQGVVILLLSLDFSVLRGGVELCLAGGFKILW